MGYLRVTGTGAASHLRVTLVTDGPDPRPQPPIDPGKPHLVYPEKAYRKLIDMPDAVMTATRSQTDPPVKL